MTQRLYDEDVELYDLAFSWDLSNEVAWLLERLGVDDGPVLEPGSGTGRMLEALARRGVAAVGIDLSERMVHYARRRLARWPDLVEVHRADMTAFDLGRRSRGAICPVNTLGYLSPAGMSRHLQAVARHLEPDSRYLVQLDLYREGDDPRGASTWKMSRGDTAVEVTWSIESHERARRQQLHRSHIRVTDGPRSGEVLDETHDITSWTPGEWRTGVAASPFEYTAVHDGDTDGRPALPIGTAGELLWHELTLTRGG